MGRTARATGGALLLGAVAALLTGCAGPDADGAVGVAVRLEAALASRDGTTACALLLPAAAEAAAGGADASCAESVGDLVDEAGADPATAAATRAPEVAVAGRQAQVVLDGDTVFLARDGDGWAVTAALCTARAGRPYDCEVEAS